MSANLSINLGLHFNGECEAAFKFYERCFGAKTRMLLAWGSSPLAAQAPPGFGAKILHASLPIGGTVLTGGDVAPAHYAPPRGFGIQIGVDDVDEAERLFAMLAEGGTVGMPLQETFWARRYGVVVDRFGIPWEINCEKPV